MSWSYKNQIFENTNEDFGFVYLITNKTTGRKYIGRKYLVKPAYRMIKGKKKRYKKESDWLTYWGSSPALQLDLDLLGKENFTREILYLVRSKGEASYVETREIFSRDALLSEDYYNSFVQCKIQSAHIKLLREDFNATTTHVSNSISK